MTTQRSTYSFKTMGLAIVMMLPLVDNVSWGAQNTIDPAPLEEKQKQTRSEYQKLLKTLSLSKEKRLQLTNDITTLKKDTTTITAALIQAAKTEKKLANDIADIEEKLIGLSERRDAARTSFRSRRAILAEVLGALQRMGLNPPPAILVKPEDALGSVRSAILLGAVVPKLRHETKMLADDLQELNQVTASIKTQRTRLNSTVSEQINERERLKLLLQEKQTLSNKTRQAIDEEQRRAEALARKATSMQNLITSLNEDIEAARSAQVAKLKHQRELERLRNEPRPVPQNHRLTTALPFEQLRGKLALPVSGKFGLRFGAKNQSNSRITGDTLVTQSGAIVSAPANGTVLYAGRFRTYGQLLIIDAGNGYHLVLAGMEKLNVTSGQNVLAGEPVGVMGEVKLASTTVFAGDNVRPTLYIEFRKDKKPVNPAPWWSDRHSGRIRNDT